MGTTEAMAHTKISACCLFAIVRGELPRACAGRPVARSLVVLVGTFDSEQPRIPVECSMHTEL